MTATAYSIDYESALSIRYACELCGGSTEREDLHPVLADAETKETVTFVCWRCWEAGPNRWPAIARDHADNLTAYIAELRHLADDLEADPPELPALPFAAIRDLAQIAFYLGDEDRLGDGDPSAAGALADLCDPRRESWGEYELGPLGRRVAARLVADRTLRDRLAAAWSSGFRRWSELAAQLPAEIVAELSPRSEEAAT